MSKKLYGVDHFYTGDFAQILIGIYNMESRRKQDCFSPVEPSENITEKKVEVLQ